MQALAARVPLSALLGWARYWRTQADALSPRPRGARTPEEAIALVNRIYGG